MAARRGLRTVPRRSVSLATSLITTLLFAESSAVAQHISTRDSAGVRIVENAALSDAATRFRVSAQPVLDMGGLDANPELEFNTKRGPLYAVSLPSGAYAVLDVTRVHYFSASGVRQRVVGRDGGGPNEFREIYSACALRGDTLVLFDGQLARISTLTPNGEFAQIVSRDEARSALPHPCFDDGTIVVKRTVAREQGVEDVSLVRMRRDGTTLNTVAVERGVPARDLITKMGTSIVAAGSELFVGDARTGEIRVYRREGGLARIIRTRDRLMQISAADIDEELDRTLPRNAPGSSNRETAMARVRARLKRTTWPVYAQFLPGDDGRLWVQSYRRFSHMNAPFAHDVWTAFDSTGRMEGRVVFPATIRRDLPGPRVIGFMRGGVLLLRYDEDGAPHFTLYPLQTVGRASNP